MSEVFHPEWLEWVEWQEGEDDFLVNSLSNVTGVTENAVFPDHLNKKNYAPRTLVDQTLEIVDPIPDICQLFVQFNAKFFDNVLLPVRVRWAKRMTSCAGTCTFHSANGECVIALSEPLLKLRPRKDLVETLLHEMIHAYLFLTQNNRDRDGHGPEFCKHMNRINAKAGTKITIYHTFHAEVALYQQHWWKCNGPCQNRGPYFGVVRRAINRAPGPSDSWYQCHQNNCGGTFMKIREPEKAQKRSKSKIDAVSTANGSQKKPDHNRTLDGWLSPPNKRSNINSGYVKRGNGTNNVDGIVNRGSGSSSASGKGQAKKIDRVESSSGLTKLGTSTNNVYGWGTGGPGSSTSRASPQMSSGKSYAQKTDRVGFSSNLPKLATSTNNIQGGPGPSTSTTTSPPTSSPRFLVSGVLGGGGDYGRSCLLDKFSSPTQGTKGKIINLVTPETKRPRLDDAEVTDVDINECPVCHYHFPAEFINQHVDDCLALGDAVVINPDMTDCPVCGTWTKITRLQHHVDECILKRKKKGHNCLICGVYIPSEMILEEHLEKCVKLKYPSSSDDDDADFP